MNDHAWTAYVKTLMFTTTNTGLVAADPDGRQFRMEGSADKGHLLQIVKGQWLIAQHTAGG